MQSISLTSDSSLLNSCDVRVHYVFEGESILKDIDPAASKNASRLIKEHEFNGKEFQTLLVSAPSASANTIQSHLFIGLGKKTQLNAWKLKLATAKGWSLIKILNPIQIIFEIPRSDTIEFDSTITSLSLALGLLKYSFHEYKSKKKSTGSLTPCYLFIRATSSESQRALSEGIRVAQGINSARDWVNEPPGIATPEYLAKIAADIAAKSKGVISAKVFNKEEIIKLKMNAFLGVSQGSSLPPRFILLHYKGVKAHKKIAFIGKGITFDTGGLSLKPAEHMETMKLDMAGAASVLAVFSLLSNFQVDYEVYGLIAACENMPSGQALRPGDILKAYDGQTIEVLNTDAEGRLTLADMLSYASTHLKVDRIVDLATLTGACMVALGDKIAGLWSNDESFAHDLETAAEKSGERVWRMPLPSDYNSLIESSVADYKNIQTGRYGGAVTAALFLKAFVHDTPWIHLDIAGPSFSESNDPLYGKGGTGFGVGTLIAYLRS